MSETPTPPPNPTSGGSSPVSMNPGESGHANLIYILYLAGLVTAITPIIGVIMAYMAKDQAPDWLRSHYRNQIHIFWKGLVYALIGSVLMVVLIGFLILLAAAVWYIVRIVKGMQAVSKGEPYANPDSWSI